MERFNGYARDGKDPEFERGETIFDRYYGDADVTPNPCLRAIETAPFYAIEAFPGELGTKGGLTTDDEGAGGEGGRRGHRGALRHRQLLGLGHGAHLRRSRGDHRPRHHLRLHRGARAAGVRIAAGASE